MRPTLRKLEVKDIGDLERLVAENVEGIEPGLKVIDSRLLLGQAAIDLVGLDAKGALVLIALDFTADEGLLLRGMDAYSWCLEYPDTICRLYPTAQISATRPPRILFIVERLTDAFVRRIKQLRFLEIDCLEFRHLEVNGASALYFDLVERLRRADAASNVALATESRVLRASPARQIAIPRQVPRGIAVPSVEPTPAPEPAALVVAPVAEAAPPVAVAPAVAELTADPEPVAEPEPIAGTASAFDAADAERLAHAAASVVEESVEMQASVVAESSDEVPASVVEPEQSAEVVEPEIRLEAAQDLARQAEPVAPKVAAEGNDEWQALLRELGVEMQNPASAPVPEPTSIAPEKDGTAIVAHGPEAPAPAPTPAAVPAPAPVQPPAWAKSPVQSVAAPSAGRTYFFAQAVKGSTPVEAPSAPAPAPAAVPTPPTAPTPAAEPEAAPAPTAQAAPTAGPAKTEEAPASFEALNLPKDGLSRQWLEFLNQLGATK